MRRSAFANATRTATTRYRAPPGWPFRCAETGSGRRPGGSGLFPGQAFLAPASHRSAMVIVVERSFEAVEDVVDVGEARPLQFLARGDRALAAAADEDD